VPLERQILEKKTVLPGINGENNRGTEVNGQRNPAENLPTGLENLR